MGSGVVVDVIPSVFIFKVLDREVFALREDVVSLCFFKGLPNCCSFDLV